MHLTRRDLLRNTAFAAALAGLGLPALARAAGSKIPVGLQLYSVRKVCEKDLPGVLKAVAGFGYKGVEYAGYYGRKAEELKKLMDDHGLVCCGTHTGWGTVVGDALKETIEFNRTIGNRFLIVPGLPKDRTASVEAVKETAKILTEQAAKAKEAGMRVGYHAHGGDFKKMENGQTEWEILFDNAGPDVVMQMDVGNCLGGGGDPYAMLKKYPGRSATIHLKEHGGAPGAALGDGEVKWAEVFDLCETIGKTEWYIVEHESGTDPVASVGAGFANLKKLGKV